ncbi:hypothetical protein LFAB_00275 [Lactiplantibacillus fabifermentans T30PCM01]|uniref:Uncharacterized protein n=1 Tax=Lactiplantibacillus fabifermentans T30PCM01 TaxID=1400520 RepID=W6TAY3_9LACO|nr:hypothetical protein LFAB_00275 [Lactiplantibacillus fabifermentans T30PCM01]
MRFSGSYVEKAKVRLFQIPVNMGLTPSMTEEAERKIMTTVQPFFDGVNQWVKLWINQGIIFRVAWGNLLTGVRVGTSPV